MNVHLVKRKTVIDWATASENNTSTFSVEHSIDGVHYVSLQTIPAAGNSSNIRNYQFIHLLPQPGINYYRIRQTDRDGRLSYSVVKFIKLETGTSLQIFPNPARQSINVVGLEANGSIEIMTADGRLVKKLITIGNSLSIDLSKLTAGVYILSYRNKGILQQQKIIKEL
jgi:hypothetical protein